MRRAVTNRYFPMLAHTLRDFFGIELDYDPSLDEMAGQSLRHMFTCVKKDPEGRIRILFVGGTEDLSRGWFRDRDVIGRNLSWLRLILIAVPDEFDFTMEGCAYVPGRWMVTCSPWPCTRSTSCSPPTSATATTRAPA